MSTLPVGDACSNIIVRDVDRTNFEMVWPALVRNMENAEFIALDTVRACDVASPLLARLSGIEVLYCFLHVLHCCVFCTFH